ncbi:MAG: hypothetical protein H5T78_13960 [Nocardia sp.]|nr:hypothetical protein [Nocardia sp.]
MTAAPHRSTRWPKIGADPRRQPDLGPELLETAPDCAPRRAANAHIADGPRLRAGTAELAMAGVEATRAPESRDNEARRAVL